MKKLFILFFLVSCGFTPMYNYNVKSNIYISPIEGINGIFLRNKLITKFRTDNNLLNKYKLDIVLEKPVKQYKALQKTGDATWQELTIIAKYKLYNGDKLIYEDKVQATESYTFVEYLVASNTAYNNAISNIIKVISDNISLKIYKYIIN